MKYPLILISLLICLIIACKLFLPSPPLLQDISFSQTVYDEEHRLLRITLATDDKYRLYTPLEDISPAFVQATLLQEDQYFFYHPGINPIALLKAIWQTYVLHTRSFGASTITMQVARLRYGIHSKTISGKFWQILKALQLELLYSKEQILEAYLNLASYGGNIEGIGAASVIYYDKPASQLNLLEALKLSVVPQNPNRRMPHAVQQHDLQKASQKLFQRWIEQHPKDRAKYNLIHLPLQPVKRNLPFLAPHFVDRILQNNPKHFIDTTLNLALQTIIERVTHRYLEQKKSHGIQHAAVMLVDTQTMEIKALVGSGNYFDNTIHGQINGTKAKRSPGSTLKPFIYALALDQGLIHPYTVLKDAPKSFSGYNPENMDKDFLGPIKAKDALILSRNIPAISLAEQLQNPTLYQFLQQAQINRLKPEHMYGLSLVLGGAEVNMEELVSLYALLANHGLWHPLRMQAQQPLLPGIRLLSPEASFLTLDMLRDTPRPYLTNSAMDKQIPVYWKTGTSSGYRDAWSIGIFGPYVLAVWMGDFTGKNHSTFRGTTSAAPLFFNLVEAINQQIGPLPDVVKATPHMNLTQVKVCEASGLLPNPHCPHTVTTWFIPGKSPIKVDDIHREIAIDSETGLRTCEFNQNTQFIVYECWSSDLLKIFAQAGVQRKVPPPFKDSLMHPAEDHPPQIVSPQQDLIYTVRLCQPQNRLLFLATADADVQTLYWFVNHECIGSCGRDQPLVWEAKSGTYTVRVVDNYGRTATRNLIVKAVN